MPNKIREQKLEGSDKIMTWKSRKMKMKRLTRRRRKSLIKKTKQRKRLKRRRSRKRHWNDGIEGM